MKIWIDLTNSPHVNFFSGMIRELEEKHELLLTCRPLANTIELLELHGFIYHVIGKHYGQSKLKKIAGFIVRIWQLYKFLRDKKVDVAISHSSFYSPVVGRMLGIKSLYLNDNEHAAGNYVSFLFANRILVPEFLDVQKVRRQWAKAEKIVSYPGVKEGVYLWDYKPKLVPEFKIGNLEGKKVVFIRPEPWTAQYYSGACNFLDDLLIGLKEAYKVVLLPRGKLQESYYREEKFSGIIIPETSISLSDIMENCDLFIGAGGTMTREAAVLGIPTISIYQDKLLDVDEYLLSHGFMTHEQNLESDYVINFLEKMERRTPDRQLLLKGKEAYELIKSALLSDCKGGKI